MSLRSALFTALSASLFCAQASAAPTVRLGTYRVVQRTPYVLSLRPIRNVRRMAAVGTRAAATSTTAGITSTIPAVVANPQAIAYDPLNKHFFVADEGDNYYATSIYKMAPNGATLGFATLSVPIVGLAFDPVNNTLYATTGESYPGRVYAISSTGVSSVLAGGASGQQDGTGTAAGFSNPSGITFDKSDGALYVVDSDRIRRVTTAGVVTTVTPAGSIGNGNGYNARPGIAYSPHDGNLYVADSTTNTVKRVTMSGTVTTIAGQCLTTNGGFNYGCDPMSKDGAGTHALFAAPTGIAADPATGALLVSDTGNNAIRRIDTTLHVATIAGNGISAETDGAGLGAQFASPVAAALDGGTLYVIDSSSSSHTVRTVTVRGPITAPPASAVTFFDTRTPDVSPLSIVSGTSALWYTESSGAKLGRVGTSGSSSEVAISAGTSANPQSITITPTGLVWYNDATTTSLGVASGGKTTEYSVNAQGYLWQAYQASTHQVAYGPDGNVYFVSAAYGSTITFGFISPTFTITTVSLSVSSYGGFATPAIAFGTDGNAYVTYGSGILKVSKSGVVLANYAYPASSISRGVNGTMWFTQQDAVGSLNTNGAIIVYPVYVARPYCQPGYSCSRSINAIAAGSDGAMWFSEGFGGIGRIATDGSYTEYLTLTARTNPTDLASGPDGNIWFADYGAKKLGRVAIH